MRRQLRRTIIRKLQREKLLLHKMWQTNKILRKIKKYYKKAMQNKESNISYKQK